MRERERERRNIGRPTDKQTDTKQLNNFMSLKVKKRERKEREEEKDTEKKPSPVLSCIFGVLRTALTSHPEDQTCTACKKDTT